MSNMESIQKIRENTGSDGYIRCEVKGADLAFRPIQGGSILETERVMDEFSSEIDDKDNVTNSELREKLTGKTIDSGELLWKPFYEIAVETYGGKELLLTIRLVSSSSGGYLDIYSMDVVDDLESIRVRNYDDDEKDVEVKFGTFEFNNSVIASKKSEYEFEYEDISDRGINDELVKKHSVNKAFETTVEEADTDSEKVYLTLSLVDNTQWIFERPTSWCDSNDFVKFVDEFGITDVSDMEGKEVYVRFEDENGGKVSLDKSGFIQLLHEWSELDDDGTTVSVENDTNQSFMQYLKSALFGTI